MHHVETGMELDHLSTPFDDHLLLSMALNGYQLLCLGAFPVSASVLVATTLTTFLLVIAEL